MTLSIATWNINSVRLRLPLVARFIAEYAPDVLCLQEIKCVDGSFPLGAFRQLGYEHIALNGQKAYHGVATLSRVPFQAVDKLSLGGKDDARHVAVTFAPQGGLDGVTLHNFYVPAGGDEPDPQVNEKFAHKLKYLADMRAWSKTAGAGRSILVGDINIAPLESDVWSHKQLLKVVSHTPVEVAHLDAVQAAGNWVDAVRAVIPPDEKLYTWWSYRAADWDAADKGRRLDHVWLSAGLQDRLADVQVVRAARGWQQPSDHVPVIARLKR